MSEVLPSLSRKDATAFFTRALGWFFRLEVSFAICGFSIQLGLGKSTQPLPRVAR